jgi:hypothetical protein
MPLSFVVSRLKQMRSVLKDCALLMVGVLLIVSPWLIRNHHITQHLTLGGVGDEVSTRTTNYFLRDKGFQDVKGHYLSFLTYQAIKEGEVFGQSALSAFLSEAPTVRAGLVKAGLVQTNAPNVNQLLVKGNFAAIFQNIAEQPLLYLDRLFWLLISSLMVAGVFIGWKKQDWNIRLVFLVVALGLPFLSATIGAVRYRFPAEPFMFILAMYSVHHLWQHLHSRS